MNRERHTSVQIVNEEEAIRLVNNPRFSTLNELDSNCYEVIHTRV